MLGVQSTMFGRVRFARPESTHIDSAELIRDGYVNLIEGVRGGGLGLWCVHMCVVVVVWSTISQRHAK